MGRIALRYFLITLQTEMGCCSTDPSASIEITLNSKTPNVIKPKKSPPLQINDFQEHPKVVNNSMRPFIDLPLFSIPVYHQMNPEDRLDTMENLVRNEEMHEGMKPNFAEKEGNRY